MLVSFLESYQNLQVFSDLRSSAYVYPVVLALHLTFISLFGAMILVTDLRLLGLAFRDSSISDVVNRLRWPKRIGFILAATCGFLLFSSKAEEYYFNAFFRTKVALFVLVAVHAFVFRRRIYNKPAELDVAIKPTGQVRFAAIFSLLLWLGILCAGRGIGYLHAPKGIHYT